LTRAVSVSARAAEEVVTTDATGIKSDQGLQPEHGTSARDILYGRSRTRFARRVIGAGLKQRFGIFGQGRLWSDHTFETWAPPYTVRWQSYATAGRVVRPLFIILEAIRYPGLSGLQSYLGTYLSYWHRWAKLFLIDGPIRDAFDAPAGVFRLSGT
jgi:hypothetical protein